MDIYLLQEGQRRGPFRVFQIKEMLDRGEAAVTDLAWHGGLDGWQPLSEVAALAPYLPRPAHVPPPLPEGYFDNLPGAPPARREMAARKPPFPWRRLGARLVDVGVMRSVLGGLAVAAGWLTPSRFLFPTEPAIIVFFVVWSIVEAWMLTQWGTTPGKWLFGLGVARGDGTRLAFHQSLARALQGWMFGWAFGLFPFTLITGVLWLIVYRRHGRAWWDLNSSIDVAGEPRVRMPRMAFVLAFFIAQGVFNTWLYWHHPAPENLPAPVGGRTLRELVDEQSRLMHHESGRP
jgi:uncharacterized RDD family membrane protein YckC